MIAQEGSSGEVDRVTDGASDRNGRIADCSHNGDRDSSLAYPRGSASAVEQRNQVKIARDRHSASAITDEGARALINVHFLMSRYLTHKHHSTRGFSSLPVMSIINGSIGACMGRGSTKLSWHPSLHSFSAPLEAWENLLQYSMDPLFTRLPP